MNSVSVSPIETPILGSTGILANAVLTDQISSVKHSFSYRARLWLTGVSLGVGLTASALADPLPRLSPAIEWGIELFGWMVFCLGAMIRIWASSYICARKSRDVVQTGPYSICRNPLYWGTLLMVAAFPLLLRSPVLAAFMIPPILLYQFKVVPVEEAVMASRHGERYFHYCAKVSRWWPNFFGYDQGEPLDGEAIGYRRECARLFWWLGLATVLDSLFAFEQSSWWFHPLHWW